MRIVPHQVPASRGRFLGGEDSAVWVKDPGHEDELEAARGIVVALFISTLFWTATSFVVL